MVRYGKEINSDWCLFSFCAGKENAFRMRFRFDWAWRRWCDPIDVCAMTNLPIDDVCHFWVCRTLPYWWILIWLTYLVSFSFPNQSRFGMQLQCRHLLFTRRIAICIRFTCDVEGSTEGKVEDSRCYSIYRFWQDQEILQMGKMWETNVKLILPAYYNFYMVKVVSNQISLKNFQRSISKFGYECVTCWNIVT